MSENLFIKIEPDISKGLIRINGTFGLPIDKLVNNALQVFLRFFLPLADLCEKDGVRREFLLKTLIRFYEFIGIRIEVDKNDAEKILKRKKSDSVNKDK